MAVILNASAGARQTRKSDAELTRVGLPPNVGCPFKEENSLVIYDILGT